MSNVNKPSLPTDLDDAAKNRVTENGRFEITSFERMRIEDVMFGAEWMASQGETIFATIDVDGGERWLSENMLQGDYDCGEEVIVQIRKKQKP